MTLILQGLNSALLATQGYGAEEEPPPPPPPGDGPPSTEIGIGRARIGVGF